MTAAMRIAIEPAATGRRRLCLFTASPEPSGLGEHMLTLAALLRDRCEVAFGCMPDGPGARLLARARTLGVETLPLDGRGDRGDPEIRRLRAWLRERRIEIFHMHAGTGWEGHTATFAAWEAGVPAVIRTEHLPDVIADPDERRSHQRLLTCVDRLICVSAGARASMLATGAPLAKLALVRNGIIPPSVRADRADVRRRLGIPPDAPLALTVARFTEQKGHAFLLDAVPAILAAAPNARFVWVGDGPLRPELTRAIREYGLDRAVLMLGQRVDVPDLLVAANCFVLPSLFEGLPIALLEAMAAGLPVVATRVCGNEEAMIDGVTGRLVPPRDPAALAAAMLEAIDPVVGPVWGRAAQARQARAFDARRMARETAAIYERVLAELPQPQPLSRCGRRGETAAAAAKHRLPSPIAMGEGLGVRE
jgi:glycosyltransferase involved in cell wall biosynthesis